MKKIKKWLLIFVIIIITLIFIFFMLGKVNQTALSTFLDATKPMASASAGGGG